MCYPKQMDMIIVKAEWDTEAEVWTATSGDVPGMVAESPTFEKLRPKIIAMIEDLIEEGVVSIGVGSVPVHIIASVTERLNGRVAA